MDASVARLSKLIHACIQFDEQLGCHYFLPVIVQRGGIPAAARTEHHIIQHRLVFS
jgi:hypothetical protein